MSLSEKFLGLTEDPSQIAVQLRHISHRLALGERVNLAIRSPEVAEVARRQLRKLLLVSQRSENPRLHVWVHGDEDLQDRILEHLESIGVVRRAGLSALCPESPGTVLACPVAKCRTGARGDQVETAASARAAFLGRFSQTVDSPRRTAA